MLRLGLDEILEHLATTQAGHKDESGECEAERQRAVEWHERLARHRCIASEHDGRDECSDESVGDPAEARVDAIVGLDVEALEVGLPHRTDVARVDDVAGDAADNTNHRHNNKNKQRLVHVHSLCSHEQYVK